MLFYKQQLMKGTSMAFDPVATAGLVTRAVRGGFRNGGETKIVIARRTYRAARPDLWDALTNPDRIPRWFLPVSGDLRVGGRYQLEGNAGGVVERCAAPESFAVTWEYGEMLSWLEVTLTPAGDSTTLELAHEEPLEPAKWRQFGPGAVGIGWDLSLMGLGWHLDGAAVVDPEKAAAFVASADAAKLIQAAATDWAAAAAAAGDDTDAAEQAAARTVAFYTMPPGTEDGS
jgi:uncharacterized protein YndB with AHSA1/START domain